MPSWRIPFPLAIAEALMPECLQNGKAIWPM